MIVGGRERKMPIDLPLANEIGFFADVGGVTVVAGSLGKSAGVVETVARALSPVKVGREREDGGAVRSGH